MFPRLLLLVFLAVSMVHTDPVHFRVIMRCDLPFYCGRFILFEEDGGINPHDIIRDERFCSNEKMRDIRYPKEMLQGDFFSSEYEFRYHMTHNCTSDGSVRCDKPVDAIVVSIAGEHNVEFDLNLINNGEKGECMHPNPK